MLWDAHRSIGESRAYLRYMIRRYRMTEPASWGIELKETGAVIGTIGFMWIQDDNRAAEVGYSLARAQWGRGIMTEALEAVIEYGFRTLKLNRIEAIHELTNPASGAVMRKCGMVHEGTMREKLFNKGKIRRCGSLCDPSKRFCFTEWLKSCIIENMNKRLRAFARLRKEGQTWQEADFRE